ncbi:hypothetical protein ACHAXN_013049 [Cyclotella atomus]
MFESIALTSILIVSTEAAGCYPVWTSGSAYSSCCLVSATVVLDATTGTTQTKNFKCTSGSQPSLSHCPKDDPSNSVQAAAAWSYQGECSGSQPIITPSPTSKPTYKAWTGAGCPKARVAGAFYEPGELAEVDGVAYKCSTANFVNAWCGNSSYKPGDSLFWEEAWTLLGSCTDTIAPTGSPNYVSLTDAGGCPDAYATGTTYEAGDKVSVGGILYQCRSWPNSAWCSVVEPDGVFSEEALTRLGNCGGTISPTQAPVFSSLMDAGGCAPVYDSGTTYEADKVSVGGNGVQSLTYQCKSFTDSGYCNQYEPGHWSKLGWKLVGYCEGAISPTSAPAFSALTDHNGCPDAYDASTAYEASDKVAIESTTTHSVVYQCSGDREETGDGCPKKYNTATTYQEGSLVTVFIASGQGVVYECKNWPNGAYCNAAENFSPESDNANMGWTLKGYCDGTISPTAAPIVYAPAAKCRWYNGTQPITIKFWAQADLRTYTPGTRVRKHDRIYKCKGWPNGLWCKMGGL